MGEYRGMNAGGLRKHPVRMQSDPENDFLRLNRVFSAHPRA